MHKDEYTAIVGRAKGYGFDDRAFSLYERSERHSGIDVAALKSVLQSKGLYIVRESIGPGYVFSITYRVAQILHTGSNFILVARKTE